MAFKQFCSFDNINSLLKGYYSFGLWLLLLLKLTVRIIRESAMVRLKLEFEGGLKNFEKFTIFC